MHGVLSTIRPLGAVVVHTVVIYLFLVVFFRLFGRRSLGQLTVIDLAIIIVMGSAVETAMVNGDVSLGAGLVCAATLLLTNRLLTSALGRSKHFRRMVLGNPSLLVHDGRFVDEHLRRAGLTRADVLEALREREQGGIETVRFAVLEVDGTINVIPRNYAKKQGQPHPAPPG